MYQLPTNKDTRKRMPIFSGVLKYFPLALARVASVSNSGNEQHNPGQPLHWARGKSTDQLDAASRHLVDYAMGNKLDDDGEPHLAKAAWRILAQLQLDEEDEQDESNAIAEKDWRDGTVWKRDDPQVEAYIQSLNEDYDAGMVSKR